MTSDEAVAFIHAQTVAATARIEAMKAENWMREMKGHTIAYGEKEFDAIPLEYGIDHNSVITTFQNADY